MILGPGPEFLDAFDAIAVHAYAKRVSARTGSRNADRRQSIRGHAEGLQIKTPATGKLKADGFCGHVCRHYPRIEGVERRGLILLKCTNSVGDALPNPQRVKMRVLCSSIDPNGCLADSPGTVQVYQKLCSTPDVDLLHGASGVGENWIRVPKQKALVLRWAPV
jgi:hypothetical protein